MLEKEAEAHSEQKELMASKFEKERNRLLQENRRLRERSAFMSKGDASSKPPPVPGTGQIGTGSKRRKGKSSLQQKLDDMPKTKVRNLSLKQLKDHITSIYASKLAFDKKCSDAHLPRETMEQHMYTYLNQKYGLRSLIIEHATAIVKGMHKYANVDNDVGVYHKIYSNVIDEEFRFVQQRLKETVTELLRVYLKGKYPRKTDDAISELLNVRLKGNVYEEEWVDIVKYMYNREDSLNLTVMVKDLVRSQPKPPKAPPGRGRPREAGRRKSDADKLRAGTVRFADFLQVLLDFQLRGHEKFLSKFRKIFEQFDTDSNGVLDENQTRQLVVTIDPEKSKGDLNKLINTVDPYNNQHVTYSECVNVLSHELVAMMSSES